MGTDVNALIKEILAAIKGELEGGWDKISGFSEKQAKRIATLADWIAESRVNPTGQLHGDDDLYDWFVDSLKEATANFSRSVALLTLLTFEQAWNAVVKVVWGAINAALGNAGLNFLQIPVTPAT